MTNPSSPPTTHQTHTGGPPGQTDSAHKLTRFKLPSDLAGKRTLDIGCNEGFFSNVMAELGADAVVGIDIDETFLGRARDRYRDPRITFMRRNWHELPEGSFDLVLWTSCMHYELDPGRVLRAIRSRLSTDGMLVLEAGVLLSPGKEMAYSIRPDGGHWYPTIGFLEDALDAAGFASRMVSHPEMVGTDPVPRSVFHCTARQAVVMLVRGASHQGKTSLARSLSRAVTKVISLDLFLSRIAKAPHLHSDLHRYIKRAVAVENLSLVCDGIDREGLTEAYAALVTKGVAASDSVVLIEGYMTDLQVEAMCRHLHGRARVWNVSRSQPGV